MTSSLPFPLFIGIGRRGGLFLAGAIATAHPLSAATPRLDPLAAAHAREAVTSSGLYRPETPPAFSRSRRGAAAAR